MFPPQLDLLLLLLLHDLVVQVPYPSTPRSFYFLV